MNEMNEYEIALEKVKKEISKTRGSKKYILKKYIKKLGF